MALPSYLDLVNDVLIRMREPTVTAVSENVLSSLIGKFINDAKRQVEDAYNWNALTQTLTADTTDGVFNYALVGTGSRFKVIDVYDNTNRVHLYPRTSSQMTSLFISSPTPQNGVPIYYNFNGIDDNGDTQVDIYPIPDAVYTIFFNLYVPQDALSSDGEKMLVPDAPVVLLALARALVDRGEDQSLGSSEAYAIYKAALSDAISIESSRYIEEERWEAT